jgi:aspartyl-tRNA(Asn)/glutamyl-tRNA(Gln) amidotransferase subunit A
VLDQAQRLADGAVTARDLIEEALDRIADPSGEGPRAFLEVAADRARATAEVIDRARAAGALLPPFAGIPLAVKDLFDVAGEVTTAGSVVLAARPPATTSATAVNRLIAAGFNLVGRTAMTEFAYSALGVNSHHDTPRSPWDRATGRIPGGSSSGSAVAVADGMVPVALGTDTGGSCRVPAAFCGIVGYKPTARRVPLDGVVPLAPSLDSVGPLAASVTCCAVIDDILAGGRGSVPPTERTIGSLRLAVITDHVTDGLHPDVAAAHQTALDRLSAAGARIVDVPFPELFEMPDLGANGGLAAAEAHHWHRELLADHADRYDQRIRHRIEAGDRITAADYLDILTARKRMIEVAARRLAGFDAFVLPTVATIPPSVATIETSAPAEYYQTNRLCLRNTSVANFLDGCAISLPVSGPGEAPVGLMLMAGALADRGLLTTARAVESLLSTSA